MKTIFDVYKNVSAWNAARYDQQLDLKLAGELLVEEYGEYFEKPGAVDKLDALGDISYVALGICWKSGISPEMLEEKLNYWQDSLLDALNSMPGVQPIFLVTTFIATLADDYEFGIADSMAAILNLAAFQASYTWGLTPTLWLRTLEAICNSNDTKVVVQVASDVKANAGNKVPNYVSPTADLAKILNEAFLAKGVN